MKFALQEFTIPGEFFSCAFSLVSVSILVCYYHIQQILLEQIALSYFVVQLV